MYAEDNNSTTRWYFPTIVASLSPVSLNFAFSIMRSTIRYTLLALLFLGPILSLSAQDYPQVRVMPIPGDSIYSMTDNLPSRIEVGDPGPDRVWDFTSLQSPFYRKFVYTKGPSDNGLKIKKGSSSYEYVERDGSLYLSSIKNADPLLIGTPIELRCSPALLEYKNPIKYQDASSEYSRFIGYIPWNRVPAQYRFEGVNLSDSIRIVLEVNRDDAVDAWGAVLMQHQAFDVVRERRIEEQVLSVLIRKEKNLWVDVTDRFKELLDGIAWNSVTYSYLYLAEDMAGPVVEIYTNENDEIEKVIFSADPKMAKEISPSKRLRGVYVYPNPTFGDVRFEFFNLADGNYELSVYNVLGKKLWTAKDPIVNSKVILADLSFLKRGTYFYSLKNESGKRIVTRRLIIMKA